MPLNINRWVGVRFRLKTQRIKTMKPIPILRVGYVLELKKPHPCGSSQFRILRVGGDVRIVCTKCGRDMTVNRIKLENAIKKIISVETSEREELSQT